jgi:outer membrane protein TolC
MLARNALSQAQLRKIQSDSERNAAVAELNSRLGLSLSTPQTIADDDFSSVATIDFDNASRIIEAAQRDPRVQAATHMLQAARTRGRGARRWQAGRDVLQLHLQEPVPAQPGDNRGQDTR